jgi:hypothetical protein
MVNYQNGKIYAIRCLTTDTTYIGCTTKDLLCKRLAEHVVAYKRYIQNKGSYYTAFEVLKHKNYIIELIEAFPCASRNELGNREFHHIKNSKCVNFNGSLNVFEFCKYSNRGNFISHYEEIVTREYALLEEHTKEKRKLQPYYKITAELRNIHF